MKHYLYDTHVHTAEVSPCGYLFAEQMIGLYNNAGYTGLIITDHYHKGTVELPGSSWQETADHFLLGYRNAVEAGRKLDMDVLLGMELRFDTGSEDYLIYGFNEEFIYEHPYLNRYTLETFRELIKGTDIMIFQAHPFRPGMTPANPALLDGVEAFNRNPRHNSHNDEAYGYGLSNNLLMLSGSDAHRTEDVGRSGILITERLHSIQEFVSLLRSGRPFKLFHME